MDRFKRGAFFSADFVAGTVTGSTNWNGYENNLLFESIGPGQFADVARPLGCDAIEDSRGVAVADFNADGRLDLAISNNNAAPAIYLNQTRSTGNWIRLELIAGPQSNRDAVGARVQIEVKQASQSKTMTRWVEAGSGYAAQSDLRLHFGLGTATEVYAMIVTWPNGQQQRYGRDELAGWVNRTIEIDQRTGRISAASAVGEIGDGQARRNRP